MKKIQIVFLAFLFLVSFIVGCKDNTEAKNKLLLEAVAGGNAVQVKKLINNKNVNLRNNKGNTLLITAAADGNKEIVSMLLKAGADPNLKGYDEYTALTLSYQNRSKTKLSDYKKIFSMLLQSGADPNLPRAVGMTALMDASMRGDKETVSILLGAGADPNMQTHKNDYYGGGMTALIIAAMQKEPEIVSMLLQANADPYLQTNKGITALGMALEGREKTANVMSRYQNVPANLQETYNKNLDVIDLLSNSEAKE